MKKRAVKILVGVLVAGVLCGGAALGGIDWCIHQSVERNCGIAQQAHPHPGDDVAALIDFMNSESHSLRDRSHLAVWTLGRLRDAKALPALESVYTGVRCDHDEGLCQHELAKAIKRCGGTPSPAPHSGH